MTALRLVDIVKKSSRSISPQVGADMKPVFSKPTVVIASRHSIPVVTTMSSTFRFPNPVSFPVSMTRLPDETKAENLSLDQRARHAAEAMACLAASSMAFSRHDGVSVSQASNALVQSSSPTVDEVVPVSAISPHHVVVSEVVSQSQADKYSGYDRHFKKKFFGSELRSRCDSLQKDERASCESASGSGMDDPRDTTPAPSPDSSSWENSKANASSTVQTGSRSDSRVSPVVVGSSSSSIMLSSGGTPDVGDLNMSVSKQFVAGVTSVRLHYEGNAAAVARRGAPRASPVLCSSPGPIETGSTTHPPSGNTSLSEVDRPCFRLTPVTNIQLASESRNRVHATAVDSDHSSSANVLQSSTRCEIEDS